MKRPVVVPRVGYRYRVWLLRLQLEQLDDVIDRRPNDLVIIARRAAVREELRIIQRGGPTWRS
jgi:hypothetical protein